MVLESHEAVDPTITDPSHYRVVFENARVRVLEYRDAPGDRTHPHRHPDSVMVTLTSFDRRISSGGRSVDVSLGAGQVRWVGAQEHTGENIGTTPTHGIFVELKEPAPTPSTGPAPLGPSAQ
ncbi:cupin domain-containing protein [Dactylosporangium darangshiense]|uniref:Cytoplasmic protein n=1 Tax=Dactylosporangium darangshiense TaxID=579108 RepID=A0ABP8DIN0_9ACTN